MKKGISLIVLVITIIVIIILSGAVILSLSNNNPITQATTAKNNSDVVTVQSAATLYLARIMAEFKGAVLVTAGTVTNTSTLAITNSSGVALFATPAGAYGAFADLTAAQNATTGLGATAAAVVFSGNAMGISLPTGRTWTVTASGTISGS